ncbi:hypothetical protein FYJ38_00230 [Clostridium sp. WB02_MRS01]|uniref:hypothetical protein n=1 Tax=Clostridium sp. WB02_MRS01 TaxID=2605777 RepID=UPI0012B28920|nr:hypothetical protein [Clostridium sp. WB02_MRS01]MSS07065.1 hypothetical protein [Clostridium sp. WB02_MRS01]
MSGLDRYEKIGTFQCGNEFMVTIKAEHGTHVMTMEEWEQIVRGLGYRQTPTGMRCFRRENCVA